MFSALTLLSGFAFNLLVAIVIVRGIYYPSKPNKNYVFTFLAFSSIIFFVMSLLTTIELSIGAGFGLFAIFSVLRYRTDTIPAREMTYLFTLVGLTVVNAALIGATDWWTVLVANAAMVAVLYVLEQGWGFHFEQSQRVTYERIGLIAPENRDLLLADLSARLGLAVTRVEIGRIDLVKETVDLKLFYDSPARSSWIADALFENHHSLSN